MRYGGEQEVGKRTMTVCGYILQVYLLLSAHPT